MTKKRKTWGMIVVMVGGLIIGWVSAYSLGLWGLIVCIPMGVIWGALCGDVAARGLDWRFDG